MFRGKPKIYPEPLLPSVLRRSSAPKTAVLAADQARSLERSLTAQFQRHAFLQLPVRPSFQDEVDWWVWMQHHGVPTRLLDWTQSQYVAAYFAVRDCFDQDGVIWVLDPSRIPAIQQPRPEDSDGIRRLLLNPPQESRLLVASPLIQTDRMLAQQTMFTFSLTILGNQRLIIEESFPESDERYGRLVISARHKMTFLRKLAAMNVTAISLFPGLEGAARAGVEAAELFKRFTEGRRQQAEASAWLGPE